MNTPTKPNNRDLSALSALLAGHVAPADKKQKKATAPKTGPSAANDNRKPKDVLAWPALERLAHRGDDRRVYALRHWRNMCYPDRVEVEPSSEEYNPEVVVEIKPSEPALLGAIGWQATGKERWHFTGEEVNTYQRAECDVTYGVDRNGNEEAKVGSLMFRNGQLVQWGKTKKGSALAQSERARGEKGGAAPGRSEAMIRSYLALKGAVSPLAAQSYFKPMSPVTVIRDAFIPQPGTQEAREILRSFGIDGGVPFHKLPFAATLCPDGIVLGLQWVGGVKKPKPLGEISAASGKEFTAVRQVEAAFHYATIRRSLRDHATVLDLAITDASARDIGIAMGLSSAYAEKRGPSLIDAAIDSLIALDEHAQGDYRPVEERLAA
ncbi:hypothetical protein GAO09_04560 [Rhizobiales bacterium RZME27]|jgi:hypothetical protein|uniref:Uncharacterized protein n=1 Tax=Endobacterium cereale TaxID=2663029 RepID=A0A6A8A655_9HYPH|nr:hypothetical protein [Endobacterium cereale]MQY45337.1 hypothetical protein [Endobacterium cereale]